MYYICLICILFFVLLTLFIQKMLHKHFAGNRSRIRRTWHVNNYYRIATGLTGIFVSKMAKHILNILICYQMAGAVQGVWTDPQRARPWSSSSYTAGWTDELLLKALANFNAPVQLDEQTRMPVNVVVKRGSTVWIAIWIIMIDSEWKCKHTQHC